MNTLRPVVAITAGDPAGIGPEIARKAADDPRVTAICEPARKALAAYDWPGNVRELRNVIESMVVQDQDGILGMDDLQDDDKLLSLQFPDHHPAGPSNLVGRPLTEVERFYIEKALEMTSGNREEAAKLLGIGERTLYRKIDKFQL